jgi:DNA replication protein DnaC
MQTSRIKYPPEQPRTTFLVGQRGTGKSTIIAMAQDKIAKERFKYLYQCKDYL